jgi:cysteine synthase
MLAKGMTPWSPASNDAADIVLAIVVGFGAAGRLWGVDAVLQQRYPRIPLW